MTSEERKAKKREYDLSYYREHKEHIKGTQAQYREKKRNSKGVAPEKTCDSFCKGCVYHYSYIGNCDYLLMTGKRRPCPPGKGCTVKKTGTRRSEVSDHVIANVRRKIGLAANYRQGNMRLTKEDEAKRMEAYLLGLSDHEIGRRCGVTSQVIYIWRKRRHLKANIQKFTKKKEDA